MWLSQFLFAPILKLFDEREKRIYGAKALAEELSGLADQKSKDFIVEYELARDEARKALSHLKHEMEKDQIAALESAKAIARDKLAKAEADLIQQEQVVRTELSESARVIADDIVLALMRRSA